MPVNLVATGNGTVDPDTLAATLLATQLPVILLNEYMVRERRLGSTHPRASQGHESDTEDALQFRSAGRMPPGLLVCTWRTPLLVVTLSNTTRRSKSEYSFCVQEMRECIYEQESLMYRRNTEAPRKRTSTAYVLERAAVPDPAKSRVSDDTSTSL